MEDKELEIKLYDFEKRVIDDFHFLETMYEFDRQDLIKIDFQYPKDRQVAVRYFSKNLCVEIVWYLIDAFIGVRLVELEKGKFPESKFSYWTRKGFSKAINLTTLVKIRGGDNISLPFPDVPITNNIRLITKYRKIREKIISNDMSTVISTYANYLRRYASDALSNKKSNFDTAYLKTEMVEKKLWDELNQIYHHGKQA